RRRGPPTRAPTPADAHHRAQNEPGEEDVEEDEQHEVDDLEHDRDDAADRHELTSLLRHRHGPTNTLAGDAGNRPPGPTSLRGAKPRSASVSHVRPRPTERS